MRRRRRSDTRPRWMAGSGVTFGRAFGSGGDETDGKLRNAEQIVYRTHHVE